MEIETKLLFIMIMASLSMNSLSSSNCETITLSSRFANISSPSVVPEDEGNCTEWVLPDDPTSAVIIRVHNIGLIYKNSALRKAVKADLDIGGLPITNLPADTCLVLQQATGYTCYINPDNFENCMHKIYLSKGNRTIKITYTINKYRPTWESPNFSLEYSFISCPIDSTTGMEENGEGTTKDQRICQSQTCTASLHAAILFGVLAGFEAAALAMLVFIRKRNEGMVEKTYNGIVNFQFQMDNKGSAKPDVPNSLGNVVHDNTDDGVYEMPSDSYEQIPASIGNAYGTVQHRETVYNELYSMR